MPWHANALPVAAQKKVLRRLPGKVLMIAEVYVRIPVDHTALFALCEHNNPLSVAKKREDRSAVGYRD